MGTSKRQKHNQAITKTSCSTVLTLTGGIEGLCCHDGLPGPGPLPPERLAKRNNGMGEIGNKTAGEKIMSLGRGPPTNAKAPPASRIPGPSPGIAVKAAITAKPPLIKGVRRPGIVTCARDPSGGPPSGSARSIGQAEGAHPSKKHLGKKA